ncbi:MAG: hypothetical protein RM368_10185 [Nostoc sp. DedSLP03]|uniref:hypothetical protein n=1 Tax=Nostoc sp. DedSLP03 TaxID=3075400 RepID=UPI002AD50E0A|nr:hypothetical protein [Nostoc sp. DedSLP03]MDZ7965330.1 hypothetical protein [Nostoc sp. DedSLP03]
MYETRSTRSHLDHSFSLAIQKGLVVPELLIKLDILKFQSIYRYLSENAVVLSLDLV